MQLEGSPSLERQVSKHNREPVRPPCNSNTGAGELYSGSCVYYGSITEDENYRTKNVEANGTAACEDLCDTLNLGPMSDFVNYAPNYCCACGGNLCYDYRSAAYGSTAYMVWGVLRRERRGGTSGAVPGERALRAWRGRSAALRQLGTWMTVAPKDRRQTIAEMSRGDSRARGLTRHGRSVRSRVAPRGRGRGRRIAARPARNRARSCAPIRRAAGIAWAPEMQRRRRARASSWAPDATGTKGPSVAGLRLARVRAPAG